MIGVDGEITQFKINENKDNNLNNNNNHNNNNNKNNNDFDKKSNITQDRYIDEEEQDDNIKLQGDNPIQENNDKVSEIFQNNTNLIPNKDSTMKFQENVENNLNQNNNKNNNQNLNQNLNQNYNSNNIPEDEEFYYENNQNYNDYENDKKSEFSNNDFVNRKLISGNISNAKGTTDTFSFKIPITKQIEPLLISIYDLPQDNEQDRFDPNLFICNMYLNKKNVFKFLQIKKNQQNYQLYTDEALNLILEKIELENGQVFILDGILNSALIR
jgi:hypothetical protein